MIVGSHVRSRPNLRSKSLSDYAFPEGEKPMDFHHSDLAPALTGASSVPYDGIRRGSHTGLAALPSGGFFASRKLVAFHTAHRHIDIGQSSAVEVAIRSRF